MNGQAPKPRRGCFFYGCITGVVLLLIMLGALLLGLHYVKRMVNQFTDNKPMELPTLQMSQAEIDKVKQRFEDFQQAVRAQQPAKPLALSADDINALIVSGPEQQSLKGKFYVSIEGDQLKSEVSIPLADVGLSMLKGRYLNGSANFAVGLHNGTLFVTPQTILVKGKPLPETYMKEIRKKNLAAGLVNQPDTIAVLKNLGDIQVKEGKVIVVPKQQQ